MNKKAYRRPRLSSFVLLIALAVFGLCILFIAGVAIRSGEISILVRFSGVQIFSRASDANLFFSIVVGHVVAGIAMLVIGIGGVFILRSKKADVFQNELLENLEEKSPSGMVPLWIGLLLSLLAFLVYVAA